MCNRMLTYSIINVTDYVSLYRIPFTILFCFFNRCLLFAAPGGNTAVFAVLDVFRRGGLAQYSGLHKLVHGNTGHFAISRWLLQVSSESFQGGIQLHLPGHDAIVRRDLSAEFRDTRGPLLVCGSPGSFCSLKLGCTSLHDCFTSVLKWKAESWM